jgi:hypothetical protein
VSTLKQAVRNLVRWAVTFIVTHIDPHDDELLGICIGRRWGRKRFPGIDRAEVVLLDAGLRAQFGGDGYGWLLKGFWCIGVLGGKRVKGRPCFDEHALPEGERENYSAATLVAEDLGVQDDPGLKPMLAYSLWADTNSYSDPFELGSLIKALHGVKTPIQEVVRIYEIGFNALYQVFSGKATLRVLVPFSKIVDKWKFYKFDGSTTPEQDENLVEINELARRNNERAILKPFNLIGLTHAMISSGVPLDTVEQVVFRYLDAKYAEYRVFNRMKNDFIADARYLETTERMPYVVAVIKSDSDQMKRAARKADPTLDVLVQILSTGHVRYFNLNKAKIRNLSFIAARVRRLIWLSLGKRPLPSLERLMLPGTVPEIDEIHNFVQQGHVFNGSSTTTEKFPLIGPQGRTERQAVECAREGLELLHKHLTHVRQP